MTAWRHISGAKRNSASQSVLKLEFGTILKRSTSHLLVLYPAHGLQVHATNMLPLPPLQPFDTFWWRNVAHVLNSSGLSDAFKLDVELITAHALHQILCHIWSVLKSQLWEVEKTESAVEQPHKPSQTSTSFLRGKTWHSESRCLTNSKACISTHSNLFSLQKYIKLHKPKGKKPALDFRSMWPGVNCLSLSVLGVVPDLVGKVSNTTWRSDGSNSEIPDIPDDLIEQPPGSGPDGNICKSQAKSRWGFLGPWVGLHTHFFHIIIQ